MGACLVLALWIFTAAQARAEPCPADKYDEVVHVESIYDGDTVKLTDGRKLRFIGINTPEMAHESRLAEPLAETARTFVSSKLNPAFTLHLRYGKKKYDRHKRLLAHPFLTDHTNLSRILIEQGLGFAIVVPPDTWHQACYQRAEQLARKARRGVWAEAFFRPIPANAIPDGAHGFRRLTGRVIRIGRGKRNRYLNLTAGSEIRIHDNDLRSFSYSLSNFHQLFLR